MIAPLGQPLAGRFVIEREVGRGGVGIVYRARDEVTGDPVALKVIALPGVDAGEEARFRREGRVLAGLRHPGIVKVVAFVYAPAGFNQASVVADGCSDLLMDLYGDRGRHSRSAICVPGLVLDIVCETEMIVEVEPG